MKVASVPVPYDLFVFGQLTMLINRVKDDTTNKEGRLKVYIVTGYDTKVDK